MKSTNIFLAAILAVIVVACNKESDTPAIPAAPSTSATTASATAKPMGNFGMALAGPFQVSLGTDSNPPVPGKPKFTAEVSKDGKPVTDAKVNLELFMPSMKMQGPKVEMKHSVDGKYEADAEIMKSDYSAKVSVESSAGKGTAEFKFTVN